MEIEFDPAKEALNLKLHRLSLSLAEEMDWDSALVEPDNRFWYGELRLNAIVPLENRLYHVTFTERGVRMRVISLRAATNGEVHKYVSEYR